MAEKTPNPEKKFRNMVWTMHADSNNQFPLIQEMLKNEQYVYVVFGLEKTQNGGYHYQGYIEFVNPKGFKRFSKQYNCWCDGANPINKQAAIAYCKKGEQSHEEWSSLKEKGPNYGKNAQIYEMGTPKHQGERNDLKVIKDLVLKTNSIKAVIDEINPGPEGVKHAENVLKYCGADREWLPQVFYIYGEPGLGKTVLAKQIATVDGIKPHKKALEKWDDGYNGQPGIVIDELNSKLMSYKQLLMYIDCHEHRLEVKGGTVNNIAKRICITSNLPPEDIYDPSETGNIFQLIRRFDHQIVIHLVDNDYKSKEPSILPSGLKHWHGRSQIFNDMMNGPEKHKWREVHLTYKQACQALNLEPKELKNNWMKNDKYLAHSL